MTTNPAPQEASHNSWLPVARLSLAVALAVVVAIWMIHTLLLVEFPFPLEYGEGAVLEFTTMLARGEPLYQSVDSVPPRACIYAPLHMWLASLCLGSPPSLWSGRVLASLALLVVLATIWVFVRNRSGSVAAVLACLFFLATPLVIGWSSLNRIDMLALAFSAAGLCVAARGLTQSPLWRTDIAAAVLFALAFLAKQSFIAAPAACIVVYLWRRPRHGLLMGALYTGLVLGEMGLLNYYSQGEAYNIMFRLNAKTATIFFPDQMLAWSIRYLASVPVLPLVALIYWSRGGFSKDPIWSLFLVGSTAIASGSGRMGGYYNYFLEMHLALSVLGAVAFQELLERLPARSSSAWALQGLAILQVVRGVAADMPPTLYSPWQYSQYETLAVARGVYPKYLDRAWNTNLMRPWLDHHPGPILVENMGNPIVMGYRPWVCDPVYYYFLGYSGHWDDSVMVDRVERGEFSVILLQVAEGNIRFTPRVIKAVLAHYHKVAEASVDSIYLPNQVKTGTP